MKPLRLLILVPLVILLGCGTRGRFDSKTRIILTGATKVEVFPTDGKDGPSDQQPRQEGERRIGGFRVVAQGPDQSQLFAAKLAELLLDDRTYSDKFAACYWPGVAFRVWKDDDFVDVVICFFCHNLYCGPPTEEARENGSFADSPAESRLVRLAKEALPDDEEIQALKEK